MGLRKCILFPLVLAAAVSCGPRQGAVAAAVDAVEDICLLDVMPEVIDLGTIKADDGPVPCTIYCVNGGQEPVRVSFVTTSCSCVSVSWPQDDVPPGGEVQIDAMFNPAGLGGEVTRYVFVREAGNKLSGTVEIKATVIPSESPAEGTLLCGRAAASAGSVDFGYVQAGTTATLIETLTNVSDERLELAVKVSGSPRLHVQCPEIVDPGEIAELVLLYSMPQDIDSIGTCSNMVEISSGECRMQLPVKAICIAPQSGTDGPVPSMWTTSSPVEIVKGFFEIGNNGGAPLEIYKIETDNGVSIIAPGGAIAPGKKKRIKVPDVAAPFSARIYTNDPARPGREIRFK